MPKLQFPNPKSKNIQNSEVLLVLLTPPKDELCRGETKLQAHGQTCLPDKRVCPTSVSAQQLLPQRLKHLNGLVFFCEAGGLQLLAAMISRQFEECFKDSVSGHCCDFTTIPPACLRYPSKCYSSALQHVSLFFLRVPQM